MSRDIEELTKKIEDIQLSLARLEVGFDNHLHTHEKNENFLKWAVGLFIALPAWTSLAIAILREIDGK